MTRSERLAVDPTACRAHGLCAEMLPDLVRLDEWGYPLLPADPIPRGRRRAVRGAVHACPALALRLAVEHTESVDRGVSARRAGQAVAGLDSRERKRVDVERPDQGRTA